MKNSARTISRRDVLIGGAAGIATLAGCGGGTGSAPVVPTPTTQTYDVIVVGAGPAGISAAKTVMSSNRSVIVLEAMNRVGGRVYTDNSLPIPFDYGAQLFAQAASLNTILAPTAKQLGIATIDSASIGQTFYDPAASPPIGPADPSAFLATYVQVNAALQSAGLLMATGSIPDNSALNVINAAGLGSAPYLALAIQFLMSVVDAAPVDQQSALDLYNFSQFSPAPFVYPQQDSLYIPSGYGNFIARLAKGIPIQLSSPVKTIAYGGSGVSVTTAGGQVYQGKTVIVTGSTAAILATISFSPALPAAYTGYLQALPIGNTYKIMLGFNGKPFDGKLNVAPGKMQNIVPLVNSHTPAYSVNYFAEQFPSAGTYAIATCEMSDADAFEAMGPAAAANAILNRLEGPFPGAKAAWNGQALASSWGTNPYTRGAMSAATPGNVGARVQLAVPINKQLWFAGEAVSVHQHSFVNGAWTSGIDAANGALGAIGALARERKA